MTHQTLTLGKYWKLFSATLNASCISHPALCTWRSFHQVDSLSLENEEDHLSANSFNIIFHEAHHCPLATAILFQMRKTKVLVFDCNQISMN